MMKEMIKVIHKEKYTYRDPIKEFLECLYVNYYFEGALLKLVECEKVCVLSLAYNISKFVWKFLCL